MPRGGKVSAYQPEFKQMAIDLALRGDKPIAHVAKELGIHEKTLHGWVYTYKKASGISTKPINQDNPKAIENEEIKHLKKENARLKMECEILKKATAYFARQTL